MHLSWIPQQCLQDRSKHILHVTLQLQAFLFHLGFVGWMKNLLSDAVHFSPHTTPSLSALSVSRVAMLLPHLLFSLCFGLCWTCKIAREASLWPGKDCFVLDEWLTQLGEYGNDVLMLPRRQDKSSQVKFIYEVLLTKINMGGVLRKSKLHLLKSNTWGYLTVNAVWMRWTKLLLFTFVRGHCSSKKHLDKRSQMLFTYFWSDCYFFYWQTNKK